MPRRVILTDAERRTFLALPDDEQTLIRHWSLDDRDHRLLETRRRDDTKLGLALQLCALRYPGRLIRPGEVVPEASLAFLAEQIAVDPEALAHFARRAPTRYEQLAILRLMTSLCTRTVSASLMLKRLSATTRQSGLAQALRQMGRIERTLFTLDWINDETLRKGTTAELNKGESRNSLVRAVNLHRLGRFRDRSQENLSIRASALNLVVTAIILWNTIYTGRVVDAMRQAGDAIPDHLLASLSPLTWEHVNLTGDYLWEDVPLVDQSGFRPLSFTL